MAYSDFRSLREVAKKLGVKNRRADIFSHVTPVEPSSSLQMSLQLARELPVKSEKAKSEMIVVPILVELRERNDKFFTIYSGDNLNVDEQKGLKGECDFVIAKDTGSFEIAAPLLQVVEAKKNDIDLGIPQCAAQMIGAKLFNEANELPLPIIYGCVTTGDDWIFLKLEDQILLDTRKYYLGNLGELLGALQIIIDYYKAELP
jgi:hypothetical protein